MWYNYVSDYLINERYQNDNICPCVFIKSFTNRFVVIVVYVDDLNIVSTPHEVVSTTSYLRQEFEMKDFGKTKFYLGIHIEHLSMEILIHQLTYTEKVLTSFNMEKGLSIEYSNGCPNS